WTLLAGRYLTPGYAAAICQNPARTGIFNAQRFFPAGGNRTRRCARHAGASLLGLETFYFDNPNFRDREGDVVRFSRSAGETMDIVIAPRVTFGSDTSELLVRRDSPQAATRIAHATCANSIPTRDGRTAIVMDCGVSEWDVLSGGRMGQVTGEDSTEVAPPVTHCVKDCQARNQVRAGAVVPGFPIPGARALSSEAENSIARKLPPVSRRKTCAAALS